MIGSCPSLLDRLSNTQRLPESSKLFRIDTSMPSTARRASSIGSALLALLLVINRAGAQTPPLYPNYPSETPAKFRPPTSGMDFERRDVMIAMRDGVKLHTVILVPKEAKHSGVLLTRTPYNATVLTSNSPSMHLGVSLWGYDNATETILSG